MENVFIGYGRNTTGGQDGSEFHVKTYDELLKAIKNPNPCIIIIDEDIVFDKPIEVKEIKNKTIKGASEDVTLSNLVQDRENSGILLFKKSENIIIQNLKFVGPGAYDCDGNDLLTFDSVKNAVVDHCVFEDGVDDNFDIKHDSNFITISYCRFRYLKPPRKDGSGGCQDHRFSNMVGSSRHDKPSEGNYLVTFAYCWWDEGCNNRMPRTRNSHIHILNCLWSAKHVSGYSGPEDADILYDGCYFVSSKIIARYGGVIGVKFNNCICEAGERYLRDDTRRRNVEIPDYEYDILDPNEAKELIMNEFDKK